MLARNLLPRPWVMEMTWSTRQEKNGLEDLSDFIPDGVFAITRDRENPKTLSSFWKWIWVPRPLSAERNHNDVRQKILNYQTLFRSDRYKRYESIFNLKLSGFRLLFLTNSNARLISLCRLSPEMPPSDFIWLVDQERMFSHGLSARSGHGVADK